jgi:dihydroorotate dehydrogenase electron transfer subunit
LVQRMPEQPKAMRIARVIDEAHNIRMFEFHEELGALPGQFIMLWLPRVDMKPFGVSAIVPDGFQVTVSNVGPFTNELFKRKQGDYVGIQGPYGRGFSIPQEAILVAGGYGSAPLAYLADRIREEGGKARLIIGARSKDYLVYRNRFPDAVFCTDDGSYGFKGFVTDALRMELEKGKPDMICTCGPEIMMKRVIEISDEHDIPCEASLERYMKCGFGVCGQCCVDDSGVRVCVSGPVFTKEIIKDKVQEFGKYHRDGTGKR